MFPAKYEISRVIAYLIGEQNGCSPNVPQRY